VITASSIDLPSAVRRGTFRGDLLYRLAFEVLTLPPLRARRDDILPLADHFGRKIAAELGAESFPGFTAEASEALLAREWTGNVRELKTVVERNTAKAWLADETLSDPVGGGMSGPLVFDPFAGPFRLQDTAAPIAPASTQNSNLLPQPANPELTEDTQISFQARVLAFERKITKAEPQNT